MGALLLSARFVFFFFNDTATTEIYTLSLHDALPISLPPTTAGCPKPEVALGKANARSEEHTSELQSRFGISYAVFCLKKNNKHTHDTIVLFSLMRWLLTHLLHTT